MTTLFVLLVGWTLVGLVTGAIACPRHPGPDSMGWMGTLIVGMTGSLLGGAAAFLLGFGVSPTQAIGWIVSIIGAIAFVSIPAFTGRAQRGT
jgi:uncharacterized membrane protein YeaQ/YmgE (transglycosylase-associated protein family)